MLKARQNTAEVTSVTGAVSSFTTTTTSASVDSGLDIASSIPDNQAQVHNTITNVSSGSNANNQDDVNAQMQQLQQQLADMTYARDYYYYQMVEKQNLCEQLVSEQVFF